MHALVKRVVHDSEGSRVNPGIVWVFLSNMSGLWDFGNRRAHVGETAGDEIGSLVECGLKAVRGETRDGLGLWPEG